MQNTIQKAIAIVRNEELNTAEWLLSKITIEEVWEKLL